MFLSNGKCHTSETLAGTCEVFSAAGGCAVCKTGYYREEKTCAKCWDECATCLNGESCSTCNDEHFMTVTGDCKAKNETVGCAGEIDGAVGCTACDDGFFLDARECHECGETFDACATCDATQCLSCVDDHVLISDGCVPHASVGHCTEAADSKCTKCSFWHRPTSDGTACERHAVWWVVLLCVVLVAGLVVIIAVNWGMKR